MIADTTGVVVERCGNDVQRLYYDSQTIRLFTTYKFLFASLLLAPWVVYGCYAFYGVVDQSPVTLAGACLITVVMAAPWLLYELFLASLRRKIMVSDAFVQESRRGNAADEWRWEELNCARLTLGRLTFKNGRVYRIPVWVRFSERAAMLLSERSQQAPLQRNLADRAAWRERAEGWRRRWGYRSIHGAILISLPLFWLLLSTGWRYAQAVCFTLVGACVAYSIVLLLVEHIVLIWRELRGYYCVER